MGFGWISGLNACYLLTTNNYNSLTDLHTLQIIAANTKLLCLHYSLQGNGVQQGNSRPLTANSQLQPLIHDYWLPVQQTDAGPHQHSRSCFQALAGPMTL
jgi:hypothetical protein